MFNNGLSIPVVGLGTWLSKPGEVKAAVLEALKVGYRHIDCARVYQNQREVGEALKEAFDKEIVKREDVFVTTKIWNTCHSKKKAKECLTRSLTELGLNYVDLVLIHWPHGYLEDTNEFFPFNKEKTKIYYSNIDYIETWEALQDLVAENMAKSIGLSNFNIQQIQRVLEVAKIKPVVNQVEMHVYLQQKELQKFCKEHDIILTAYSPLSNPASPLRDPGEVTIFEDETLIKIAAKHSKSVAQVALRYLLQLGVVIIPKSISPQRIAENFDIFNFSLDEMDMEEIKNLDREKRYLCIKKRDGDHPYFPW
uniref:Alcohol dehydrogenase [NADP(+)] (inferred by orthology to a human protein) n=1 Tax=Strongyloides venezuelensis TaxID=75913 RepID=A0A0K0FCR5_STRVS